MDLQHVGSNPTFRPFDLAAALAHLSDEERNALDYVKGPFGIDSLAQAILVGFHASLNLYDCCFANHYPRGNQKFHRLYIDSMRARLLNDRDQFLHIDKQVKSTAATKEEADQIVIEAIHCQERMEWHIQESKKWMSTPPPRTFEGLSDAEKPFPDFHLEKWVKTGKFSHYPSPALKQCAEILAKLKDYLITTEKDLNSYVARVLALKSINVVFKDALEAYIRQTRAIIIDEEENLAWTMSLRIDLACKLQDLEDDDVLYHLGLKVAKLALRPFIQLRSLTPEMFDFFAQYIAKHKWVDANQAFSLQRLVNETPVSSNVVARSQNTQGLLRCQLHLFVADPGQSLISKYYGGITSYDLKDGKKITAFPGYVLLPESYPGRIPFGLKAAQGIECGITIYQVVSWNLAAHQLDDQLMNSRFGPSSQDNERLLKCLKGLSNGLSKTYCQITECVTKFQSLASVVYSLGNLREDKRAVNEYYLHWQTCLNNYLRYVVPRVTFLAESACRSLGGNLDSASKLSSLDCIFSPEVLREFVLWSKALIPVAVTLKDAKIEKLFEVISTIETILSGVIFHRIFCLTDNLIFDHSPQNGLPRLRFAGDEFRFIRVALESFKALDDVEAAKLLIDLFTDSKEIKNYEVIEACVKKSSHIKKYDFRIFMMRLLKAIVQTRESLSSQLIEQVNKFDSIHKPPKPTLTVWFDQRKDDILRSFENLKRFLKGDLLMNQAQIEQDIEAVLAGATVQPLLRQNLKAALEEALKRYDGSSPLYSLLVRRLQDPALTKTFVERRFNYLLVQAPAELAKDKELHELIFSDPGTNESVFKKMKTHFKDHALSLGTVAARLDLISILFSAKQVQEVDEAIDEIYFRLMTKSVMKESEILSQVKVHYPEFPRSKKYKTNVDEWLLSRINTRWTHSLHELAKQVATTAVLYKFRLKWLEQALSNDACLMHFENLHEYYIGTGFGELVPFYGAENIGKVLDYTAQFLQCPFFNARIFDLLKRYYVSNPMPPNLDLGLQEPFSRYQFFCQRFQDLSDVYQEAYNFSVVLKRKDYVEAFRRYDSLLTKRNNTSDLSFGLGLEQIRRSTLEWLKTQFAILDNSSVSQVKEFKAKFVERIEDADFKRELQEICVEEDYMRRLHTLLGGQITNAYAQRSWLIALDPKALHSILKFFAQAQKVELAKGIDVLSAQGMDHLTREATSAFNRLLTGRSKNAEEDQELVRRSIAFYKYLESFLKTGSDNAKINELFSQIKTECPADQVWVIQKLQEPPSNTQFSKQQNEKFIRWHQALLHLFVGQGDVPPEKCIVGAFLGYRRLNPDYVKQLFDDKGKLTFTKEHNRHPVKLLQISDHGIYMKFFPDAPGVQCGVNSFERLWMRSLIPKFEPLRFPSGTAEQEGSYSVIASEEIPGKTLFEHWKNKIPVKLNPISYSERVLSAALLVEQDGKPENYLVTPQGDLVNIDNDQALADPIEKIQGSITLLHLTSVYCFDEMNNLVEPEVVEQFTNINIYVLLKQWVSDVRQLNDRLLEMFPPSECKRLFTYQADNPILVPIPLTSKIVESMWKRLHCLQRLFRSNPRPTHMDVLEALHPDVASYYKAAFRAHTTPLERFTAVSKRAYIKIKNQTDMVEHFGTTTNSKQTVKSIYGHIPDMRELARNVGIDGHEAIQKLEDLQVQREHHDEVRRQIKFGDLSQFKEIKDHQTKEAIINGDLHTEVERVNISEGEPRFQKDLLREMVGVNWTTLELGGCQCLDDTLLENLITHSKNLVSLNLSNCPQITLRVIRRLPELCPNLQVLNLSQLPITELAFSDKTQRLKKLTKLVLNGCSKLERIALKSRELRYIAIAGCPLSSLEVYTRQTHITVREDTTKPSRILKRGLVILKEINQSSTPWTLVCHGNHPMVKKMLQEQTTLEGIERFSSYKRVNYNAPNKEGLTLLHLAILSNWPNKHQIIERLFALGAEANCVVTIEHKHYSKMNAVHLAVEKNEGTPALWDALVKAKAKFNMLNADLYTPLVRACERNVDSQLMQILLQIPAVDPNYQSPKKGLTALHIAATRSSPAVIRALLDKRANSLALTDDGGSTFEGACIAERLDNADLLLTHGAPLNQQRVDGRSVLHAVCEFGLLHVVNYLIEKKINLNLQTARGETALHISCRKGDEKVAQRLLDGGADYRIPDKDGITAEAIIKSKKLNITIIGIDVGS